VLVLVGAGGWSDGNPLLFVLSSFVFFFGNSPCRVGPTVSRHSLRDAGFDKASRGPLVAVSRGTRRAVVSSVLRGAVTMAR
jgi:hypothetical protein